MRSRPRSRNYAEGGFSFLTNELKVLRNSFFRRLFLKRRRENDIVQAFRLLYFDSYVCGNTFWLGIPVLKCPLDVWIYQELIARLRPEKIIECGTAHGGSALFMASICDLIDHGEVLSIDIAKNRSRPRHDRITYLLGSSTSSRILDQVRSYVGNSEPVMVVLDSDHQQQHVLEELRSYSELVTRGSYMIVEDTIRNGHPAFPDSGPGPMEAVDQFLRETSEFTPDRDLEKHLMTFNPKGYLRRIRQAGHASTQALQAETIG